MGSLAGQVNRPSLTIGGRVFTDLDNLKFLKGYADSNSYSVLNEAKDASGAYQVPTGKKFVALAVICFSKVATYGTFGIGYGDTDIGEDSASQPTNPVLAGGYIFQGAFNTQKTEFAIRFEIAAEKYGYVGLIGASPRGCTVVGYEEDA